MASYRSPYEILNVSPDAELIVIEAAHKALIKKYHPDLWLLDPTAQSRAASINQAFAILKNPETREDCDRQLRALRNAVQGASLQRSRPRPRSPAWWTGWLAALIVAGAQFIPWSDIELPAVQLASRPALPSVPAVPPSKDGASEAQTASALPQEKPLPDGLLQLVTKAREQESAFLATLDERAVVPAAVTEQASNGPRRRAAARKRHDRRQPVRVGRRAEPDFLEREGYIY